MCVNLRSSMESCSLFRKRQNSIRTFQLSQTGCKPTQKTIKFGTNASKWCYVKNANTYNSENQILMVPTTPNP